MKINLYPEMNSKIADIMRVSEQPAQMYGAALIDAYRASGLEPDEITGREDYIAGAEAIVRKFRGRMEQINNIAVEWQETGPYEDANAKALEKMMEIEKLSRLPQPPKEEK